ncbi:hypothetical protein LX16_3268 [Stackebrandtia albiflava]|uniref:Uncharacterized protein n=1 Tax=Stackebrandtia albiflava TaxID=406432 RepID=A0A562V3M9_9ACTN|nr:hypothetical protein [Stackebrandtia albiflava]TWJ12509.1 hypothetical protein LX16_3268 [Stackebrandtia albiflava]
MRNAVPTGDHSGRPAEHRARAVVAACRTVSAALTRGQVEQSAERQSGPAADIRAALADLDARMTALWADWDDEHRPHPSRR